MLINIALFTAYSSDRWLRGSQQLYTYTNKKTQSEVVKILRTCLHVHVVDLLYFVVALHAEIPPFNIEFKVRRTFLHIALVG